MRVSDLVIETVSSFNSNRVRSLLTILGVVIGISAVISMTALIGGVKSALVGEMGLSQARLVNIYCDYGRPLSNEDVSDMQRELDEYYETVSPLSYSGGEAASSKEKASCQVMGVEPAFASIRGLKLSKGRFFSQSESDMASLVVVLDEAGVKKLFGSAEANVVGQTLRISGSDYEIVGVMPSGEGLDTISVYMPFKTAGQRLHGNMDVDQAYALAREDVDVEEAANKARDWLIERFRIPESEQEASLYIYTMKSIIDELDTMMASFQMLMTAVASVSLLVGGIGIMNMMLTNVTERIREIGLRKALGARRRDITRQFLLESVCMTLIGGVLGILLGFAGASALAGFASKAFSLGEGVGITPTIGPDTVAMVAGICVAIGIVFGYYPAHRAAKLDPVESLHYQ